MTLVLGLTGWATGASAAPMSARLLWQPSPAFGVVGYRIYMRTLSGSYGPPADAGLPWPNADGTLDFIMANLDGATSYAFAVSAYDAKGVESGLSREVMLLNGTSTSTTAPRTTSTTRMSTTTTTTVATVPCGDVNGDEVANIGDALVVAQFDVGLRQCRQLAHPGACDVNHDGACNIGDALRMAQCDVGLIRCAFTCNPFVCR